MPIWTSEICYSQSDTPRPLRPPAEGAQLFPPTQGATRMNNPYVDAYTFLAKDGAIHVQIDTLSEPEGVPLRVYLNECLTWKV